MEEGIESLLGEKGRVRGRNRQKKKKENLCVLPTSPEGQSLGKRRRGGGQYDHWSVGQGGFKSAGIFEESSSLTFGWNQADCKTEGKKKRGETGEGKEGEIMMKRRGTVTLFVIFTGAKKVTHIRQEEAKQKQGGRKR